MSGPKLAHCSYSWFGPYSYICFFFLLSLYAASVTMKRCFKCVSNQKCSTGNLQSLWGRCEMCSPCHFCSDRSTLHVPRCQIPPPSHYCRSNALDGAVRKSRESPAHWPVSGQLADLGKDSQIKRHMFTAEKGSGFMGLKSSIVRWVKWKKEEKKLNKKIILRGDMMTDSCSSKIWLNILMDSTGPHFFIIVFSLSRESNLLLITSWSLLRLPWHHRHWVDCPRVKVFVSVWAGPRLTLSSEVLMKWNLDTWGVCQVRGFCIVCWELGPRRLRKALHMQRSFGIGGCLR